MAQSTHPNPHAIVFAYPFQGHITPTTNLSLKLASKGFTITYIQIEFIHHTIAKANDHHHDATHANDVDFFVEARKSGLDVHYTTISDGFPLEFDRHLNLCEYWESMILDFPARVDELVGNIIRSHAPATDFLLIADSMYTWPSAIAMIHNLVHVSLWTASAAMFSINYNLDLLKEKDRSPCVDNSGVPSITTKDKMSNIQEPDAVSLLMTKVVHKAFDQVKNADFILCNTVQELESETLSSLNQKQTYAVGPINFFAEITKIVVEKSLFRESDCTQWLNSKPPCSVLYISFGSISPINKQEIREIAHALLLSEVNFIWVLKSDSGNSNKNDVFPIGFLDRVKDRGLIVPWCNQNMVLSDVAIAGFVTHCGWNSILESMWNGVPMICHPILVDQPKNRKLVVDDWKIGINLCDGGEVTREEVVSKINILMMGKTCVELRDEMKKVSKKLRSALDNDGSSRRKFDQFVHDLKARLYRTREDGSK